MGAVPSLHSLALLLRVGARTCALPLTHVGETMRPLPVEPIIGMPPFVRGLSVIRGHPTPVVDLGGRLGAGEGGVVTRFVTLRAGERQVALAVDAVLGVGSLDTSALEGMPPLLREASADTVAAIGTLDAGLLVVLRATRIVPAEVWEALAEREAVP
jgi:purine-binding chemotaxis protein CheW